MTHPRGFFFVLVLLVAGLFAGCDSLMARQAGRLHILFVGNSLTYVGNLPAVVESIGASNGNRISTEMLVAGGATLTERLNDGSVEKLLQETRYDYVVLQERGGDVLCDVDEKNATSECDSVHAHVALGQIIRAHRAKVILLGTYQRMPAVSKDIEVSERNLAKRIGAIYIPVSERLRLAVEDSPEMNWFYADGGHPGHDLILLEAIWINAAISKTVPSPGELRVGQTMFEPSAHFDGSIPASKQQGDLPSQPYVYDEERTAKIFAIGRPKR
jgi:hypothetical protein